MTTTIRQVCTPAGDPAWLVGGYDGVRALLTDPRLGRSHPDPERAARYSRSMIFGRPQPASPTERADHARMRRLLSPSFSARRLAGLRDRVSELVRGLLDEMERGGSPADLHEVLAFPLPVLVICELLGVPYTDREQFRRACDDAADMTDEARSMSGLATLWQYMVELVERKRSPLAGESRAGESRPGESDVEHVSDVLSDLLAAHVEDPAGLPTAEVAELGAALLFAGHETTVNAIDKGAVLLLTQPGRWDALGATRSCWRAPSKRFCGCPCRSRRRPRTGPRPGFRAGRPPTSTSPAPPCTPASSCCSTCTTPTSTGDASPHRPRSTRPGPTTRI